jgi:hypothetical protein
MADEQNDQQKPDPAAEAAAATAAAEAAKGGNQKPNEQSALDKGGEDKGGNGPTDFPENWRELAAGGDAKLAKELERFATPVDLAKAEFAAKQKIRAGSVSADPPPDGEKDPDGLKKWREERGIPLDPADYKVPDDTSKRLYDEDKPILESFIAEAHKANMPQAVVDFATGWYVELQEKAAEAEAANDKALSTKAEDDLRSEWGQDYRPNMSMAKRVATETVKGIDWFDARLPDGRKLGDIPEFIKGLVQYGRNAYGDGAFVGEEAATRTTDRIKEIENIMATDISKYTPAVRAEYAELMAAQVANKAAKAR